MRCSHVPVFDPSINVYRCGTCRELLPDAYAPPKFVGSGGGNVAEQGPRPRPVPLAFKVVRPRWRLADIRTNPESQIGFFEMVWGLDFFVNGWPVLKLFLLFEVLAVCSLIWLTR